MTRAPRKNETTKHRNVRSCDLCISLVAHKKMHTLVECLSEHFDFDEINLIETGVSGCLDYGLFGLFFAHVVDQYDGQMHSVDLNYESCLSSENIFKSELPNLTYKTYCQDSVEFLKNPPIIPNIIHLDSYDFQLFNPFPSALHVWKEFKAIEHLMPKGSIIIIDDNWKQDTILQWIQNEEETRRSSSSSASTNQRRSAFG